MTALLTPNRHHLVHGAAWRMDTAGAPKPYVPIPSRPLKKGEAARCQCGATSGCGVDLQIAQQRASEKCFNCRLRKFAAFDPRGPDDPAAIKDAIKRVFKEEMKNRFKVGGCRCDLPIGRMFDPETKRPYGWFQGHIGMSRDDSEDLQGGKYRAEVRAGKVHKEAWWERSEPGARYTENGGIANARSRERLGDREHDSDRIADSDMSKLGGEKYFPCRSFVYAPTSLPPSSHDGDGTEPPEADLELEFIYGYSAGWLAGAPSSEAGIKMGSDVQDNLYWTAAGELVYPAAATGVVYDDSSPGTTMPSPAWLCRRIAGPLPRASAGGTPASSSGAPSTAQTTSVRRSASRRCRRPGSSSAAWRRSPSLQRPASSRWAATTGPPPCRRRARRRRESPATEP